MDDYISRKAAKDAITDQWWNEIDRVPAADVVSRDCFDRILAENDTMRKQLAEIKKKPGDKMDNVRPVVHARWACNEEDLYVHGITASYRCSECGYKDGWFRVEPPKAKYCGGCGEQMDGGDQ